MKKKKKLCKKGAGSTDPGPRTTPHRSHRSVRNGPQHQRRHRHISNSETHTLIDSDTRERTHANVQEIHLYTYKYKHSPPLGALRTCRAPHTRTYKRDHMIGTPEHVNIQAPTYTRCTSHRLSSAHANVQTRKYNRHTSARTSTSTYVH